MTRRALLVLLLALGVPSACGRRARPLAPELVQPMPPTGLVARTVPDGVQLVWRRPDAYSGGARMKDLGGFDVERAAGEGGTAGEYRRVGRIELTDQTRFRQEQRIEWLDREVTPGARYRYRVTAFTLDGYRSTAAGPVDIEAKALRDGR
ncbi:MAG: fibronectin type III domain-containing protein [Candidatus Binatia bacterium]